MGLAGHRSFPPRWRGCQQGNQAEVPCATWSARPRTLCGARWPSSGPAVPGSLPMDSAHGSVPQGPRPPDPVMQRPRRHLACRAGGDRQPPPLGQMNPRDGSGCLRPRCPRQSPSLADPGDATFSDIPAAARVGILSRARSAGVPLPSGSSARYDEGNRTLENARRYFREARGSASVANQACMMRGGARGARTEPLVGVVLDHPKG